MTKKRTLLIVTLVILASLPIVYYFYGEYQKKRLINPAITPAFYRIENYVLRYSKSANPNREEYTRCQRVVWDFFHLRRNKDIYHPSNSEYYGFLVSLRFKLPPYMLEKPASWDDKRWAKEQAEKLLKEQDEILIKLYDGKRPGQDASDE